MGDDVGSTAVLLRIRLVGIYGRKVVHFRLKPPSI